MIFRNFDTWDTYFDTDRKLLRGCVQFMLKDGSTVANIYDSDEQALANPQIMDNLGRTEHQVFVADAVRAYFYKYIGQGTVSQEQSQGIDTTDTTKWILQYTIESEIVDQKEVEGSSAMGVSTMDNLRAIDPYEVPLVDGARIVCLMGYYEAGDKEPVYYVWEEESEQPDNNGSVIQSDGSLTGRWRMVQPTEHCDSRHFGVFPQDSANANVDHGTGITQLVDYCNLCSIRPFFNGSTDYPYFRYSMINVTSKNPIDVSAGTAFVDLGNSYMYGDFLINASFHFVNGNTNIKSRKVRTAWNAKTYSGYDEVIIDTATTQNNWRDALVHVAVGTSNKTFTNCVLDSDHKLGNNTFSKCQLTGAMIANNAQYTPTVDDTVIIDLDDFSDVALWLRMRDQQSGNIYDMHGRTVSSGAVNHDIYWINAVFDNYSIGATTMATFEDCLGTVTVDAPSATVSVQDSILTLSFGSTNSPVLNLTNSTIILPDSRVTSVSSISATGSTVTGQSLSISGNASVVNCQLNVPCICSGMFNATQSVLSGVETVHPNLVDCDIYGTITQAAVASPIIFTISGCRFLSGNGHLLSSTVPNTVVAGSWVGNISNLPGHFITIDRTNIDPDEQHHPYTYEGNSGPHVLQKLSAKWTDTVDMGPDYGQSDAQGSLYSKQPKTQQHNTNDWAWMYYPGRMDRNTEQGGGHTNIDYYLTEFAMFSVGTQNIGRLVLSANLPQHATQDMAHATSPVYNVPLEIVSIGVTCNLDEQERLWFSSNVGTAKGIGFVGGYTWRVLRTGYFGGIMAATLFTGINWTFPVSYEIHP